MVVIRWGQGGRVDEHKQRFSDYRLTRAKSASRPVLLGLHDAHVLHRAGKPLHRAGAFMAFHAVRGMARKEYMENETWLYYSTCRVRSGCGSTVRAVGKPCRWTAIGRCTIASCGRWAIRSANRNSRKC